MTRFTVADLGCMLWPRAIFLKSVVDAVRIVITQECLGN